MNEELVDRIVEEVRRRQALPLALLIGDEPPVPLGWDYVTQGEYQAVVIGSMTAAEVLHFPCDACAEALLLGKPVYLYENGLKYRPFAKTANRAFWCRLLSAERQMKQVGVQFVGERHERLLTAEEVRRRLRDGQPIEGRLTPLARDVLEGKA